MPIRLRRVIILFAVVSTGWWAVANTHNQARPTGLKASFTHKTDIDSTRPTYCRVVSVRLTDTSSGSPTSWRWTFDNDKPSSTEQNPVVDGAGLTSSKLRVTLTIRVGGASSSVTEEIGFPVC
jgi:hypothetical protein